MCAKEAMRDQSMVGITGTSCRQLQHNTTMLLLRLSLSLRSGSS